MQGLDPNEIARLSPAFQNIKQQQSNQQMALAQQNQLAQQAGQSQGGGMNALAMAIMLRKKNKKEPANIYDYSTPMPVDTAYDQAGY